MGVIFVLRSLRKEDKKSIYSKSLTDFGGCRIMITSHFSLIGVYNGLPSFNTKVRLEYVK